MLLHADANLEGTKLVSTVEITGFVIHNIVASTDVGFSINLEALAMMQQTYNSIHYEPEIFCGLIYRFKKIESIDKTGKRRNLVTLIFASGKVVFAGAKTRKEIFDAHSKIYPLLFLYRKN